jgi:hypothetical protein
VKWNPSVVKDPSIKWLNSEVSYELSFFISLTPFVTRSFNSFNDTISAVGVYNYHE